MSKGHWTKGKRRNGLSDSVAAKLRRDIRELARRRLLSAACRRIGIARKTAYRWLADIDRPTPTYARAMMMRSRWSD